MKVKTEEELVKAVNNNENYIEIEGDLSNKVFRIKAVGSVPWIVAIGSIVVATVAVISLPKISQPKAGFMASGIGAATAGGAVAILGLAATTSAIKIAVAGGAIGVLKKLRNYKMEKISDTKLILKK